MLPLGWSIALTVLFVAVGAYCVWQWLRQAQAGAAKADPAQVVHLNHGVMSVLMIVMIWWPTGELGSQMQALVFAVFAAVQFVQLAAAKGWVARIDLGSHIVMNVVMIWMLLAMPLLMGHAGSSSGSGGAHHGGGDDAGAPMTMTPTPAWAETLNVVMIALSLAIAAWWVARLVRQPATHRLHSLCHALAAVGMALMLTLM